MDLRALGFVRWRSTGSALAGELVLLLQQPGLSYWQHVVARVAEIRGAELPCASAVRAARGRHSVDREARRRPPSWRPSG
jgi:hypothetical protein